MKYRFFFLTTLLTITTISWTAETPETNGALSVDEHRQLLQKAIERCNKRCSVTSGKTCFSKCMLSCSLQRDLNFWKRATSYCGPKFVSDATELSLDEYHYLTSLCFDREDIGICLQQKMRESEHNRKTAAKEAKDGIDKWALIW